jgi:hypothetical protein
MKSSSEFNVLLVAVLCAWVPLIFVLFAFLTPRRAVIVAFVFGYLLLPDVSFYIHTLPNINKGSLTSLGLVLASLTFDGGRLFSVRARLIDLPVIVLCLSPTATSLANGLGIMDGISSSLNMLFTWGLAYWIGRAYFTDWTAIRELVVGIIIGGLVYLPLCWWESRMSPMLALQVYGQGTASFRSDNYMFGVHLFGFRPNVFLSNGLTVTMYMGVCTILAFWAWQTGSPARLRGIRMGWIALALMITTIVSCKAMGGIVLMMMGIGALLLVRFWPRTRIGVLALIIAAPLYITVRTATNWSGKFLVDTATVLSRTRGDSLEFRLQNEDLLTDKALQNPLLGWGGWSRSHVYDLDMNDISTSDGFWIITLGERGLIGLAALVAMLIGTSFLLWRRVPTAFWTDPACSAAVALGIVITLYMIDALFNATFNPITALSAGAVASIGALAKRSFSQKALRPQRPRQLATSYAAQTSAAPAGVRGQQRVAARS